MWYVTSLSYHFVGAPPNTAIHWLTLFESMSPRWIHLQLLYVRTEVLCFRVWTLQALKAVDFSTQPELLWALSSEKSCWQRSRHQHWYYKGLKTDRAPEALASLPPWILHNKVHNTQYPHLSCPPFMIPVRGPDGFIDIKMPPENWISIKCYGKEF